MAKLTATSVKNWKATDKRQEVPDALCPGLYLVVQPKPSDEKKPVKKSFVVRYRAGGKHRRMKLTTMVLKDAREAAREALSAAMEGGDPAGDREAKREARASDRDTVAALIKTYDKRHLSTLKSGKTVKRELERHVVSQWGNRDIHDIAKRDVLDLLEGIADTGRGVTANRVRAYLKAFLAWCVNRDVIDRNPADGVKPPAKETARDRWLTDDEIRWFWRACETEGQPWGHMGKLLLLTGQRLGEVAKMTDDEIRGDLWHLSADRTKNGRAHDLPLSKPALDVLADVKGIGDAGLIFTTNGRSPVQSFAKPRDRLAAKMVELAGHEISPWGFHDLRRTCATGMASLGVPVRVTEAVLNHASGTGGGIVGVYQRHDYATEKRDALNAWANHLIRITTP